MEQVRKSEICFNCLQPGHFTPKCASDQKCQKCQKSHLTLLHSQFEHDGVTKTTGREAKTRSLSTEPNGSSETHSSHLSSPNPGSQSCAHLMMCQVAVETPEGHLTRVRALLDCASSTSFVTERLAQRLQLPRRGQRVQVAGFGGDEHTLSSRSVVTFTIANVEEKCVDRISRPRWKVEAVVLHNVATDLPVMPVHLTEIGNTCRVFVWLIRRLVLLDTLTFFWVWTCSID